MCLFLVYIRDSRLQNTGNFCGVTDVHDFEQKEWSKRGMGPSDTGRVKFARMTSRFRSFAPHDYARTHHKFEEEKRIVLQFSFRISLFFIFLGRLQLRIDCETIARKALPGQQEPEAVVREAGVAPITSSQSDVVGRKRKPTGNGNFPSPQDVLNSIASKYLKVFDPSKLEDLNGFIEYLEKVRKVLLIDSTIGSLIVTVECSSLQILNELWQSYLKGDLDEMAQKFLVTEDILEELGLVEVKLKTTIAGDEYRACREYFLKHVGEYVKC